MPDRGSDRREGAPRRRRPTAATDEDYRHLVLLSLRETPRGLCVADMRPRNGGVDRIERELLQVHLPMLEAAGYIEWDRETGEVTRGPNFEEAESLLSDGERPPFEGA